MSVFDEHKEEIEEHETMLARYRGRLAIALDLVTDALTRVGLHGIYCHRARDSEAPALDVHSVMRDLHNAKELVQSVMEELPAECEHG